MKKIIITALICVLGLTSYAQIDENLSFSEIQSKAIDYFRNNNADSAILYMEFAYQKFPENDIRSINILGSMYTRAGHYSKAIDIWKLGIEKGHYYNLNNPRYQEFYKDNVDFAAIAKIEKDKIDAAHMKHEVILPSNYDTNKSYPTVFIFHGNNRSIETSKQSWISKTMKDECITVFLQSYVHMDQGTFQWLPNDEKTNKEFKEIYDAVMANYAVNKKKIIFTGMSAGGRKAIEYAFNEFVPMSGLVLNCPVIPNDIQEDAIQQFVSANKKIGIITGENDFALVAQKKLVSDIEKIEGQSKLIENKGLGHEFPENFSNFLDDYLQWVIE